MTNLEEYYKRQAGTGISVYPGVRYQRGHGFFGRFTKGTLLPLLSSLGHKFLSTGVDVASDIVNNRADPLTSIKTRGVAAAKDMANEVISTAKSRLSGSSQQSGTGYKKTIKGVRKRKTATSKSASVSSTSAKRKKRTVKKKPAKSTTKKRKTRTTKTVKRKPAKKKTKRTTKSKTSSVTSRIPKCFAV